MIDRQEELLRVGAREAGVAVAAPLHRRAHAVAVAEVDVVAHADLVAVVDDRRAGQREQQARSSARSRRRSLPQQRREAAADAEVDPRAAGRARRRGTCSRAPRRSPSRASARRGCAGTAPTGSCRGSPASAARMSMIGKRSSMLQRHEQPRHQREVEGHVALVAVAEVGDARPRATGWPRPAACGRGSARRRARAAPSGRRASRAGSRSWCPRARTGTARRRGAGRRRPSPARSRAPRQHAARTAGLSKFRSGWWE